MGAKQVARVPMFECPWCKVQRAVRLDGTFYKHNRHESGRPVARCDGSNRPYLAKPPFMVLIVWGATIDCAPGVVFGIVPDEPAFLDEVAKSGRDIELMTDPSDIVGLGSHWLTTRIWIEG